MKIVQEQKLEQKLILTQEMRQSLEILQLPLIELREIIVQEVMENPLLEMIDENIVNLNSEETEIDEYFEEFESYNFNTRKYDKSDLQEDYARKLAIDEEDFLSEFKKEIFNELDNEKSKMISEFILDNIDDHGFFMLTEEEFNIFKEATIDEIERVRESIKTKQPKGVACKNIQEYLKLQFNVAKDFEFIDEAEEIMDRAFMEFTRKKIRDIKKITGIQEKIIRKIYEKIKEFNPYPLFGISLKKVVRNNIFPEVLLKFEDEKFEIFLVDKYLPELKFNNAYYKELSQNEEAIEYLKEKAHRAKNLQKSIEQRNLTLYRVANKIVEFQKEFFVSENKNLRPLTLAEIAKELDLHESTISRVVNGKYMDTPNGVFELKYFFDGKVETYNGEEVSISSVQNILKEIVKGEDKSKPFTDKEICEILEAKGLKISQRTVANYREAVDILPTYLRKEI